MIFSLQGWQTYNRPDHLSYGPRALYGILNVAGDPADTYFDYDCAEGCQDWLHGAVFINGFNIGRYHQAGPQKTLYIPGPFLREGTNEVRWQDHHSCRDHRSSSSLTPFRW